MAFQTTIYKKQVIMYQRTTNIVFDEQIGKNMEIYIDDMLTKRKAAIDHIKDIGQTFD